MPSVDLRLLTPFVALAEELHFGRAAARMHVAQSALSQQIKRLERQLGVRLFERDTRNVRLSPAGEAFLVGARSALAVAEQAVEDARQAGRERRLLRLGVDLDLPERVIRRLRQFGTARPDVELRLIVQQQDDLLRDLAEQRVHAAVVWTHPPAEDGSLTWEPLIEVELHGVVPCADPLAEDRALDRAALSDRCVALYQPSRATRPFYDFLLSQLADGGAGPRVLHVPVLDDAQEAMLDMVETRGGFTVSTADNVWWRDHPDLVALPFDPPLFARLALTWPRHREPPLLTELRNHFGASAGASPC